MRTFLMLACVVAIATTASAIEIKLDCGSSTSPVMAGWVGISDLNRLDNGTYVALGDGIIAGASGWNTVSSGDRGTSDYLLRDFLQPRSGSIQIQNLPAGDYIVTVITGDPSYTDEKIIVLNGVEYDLDNVAGSTMDIPVSLPTGGNLVFSAPQVGFPKMAGIIVTPEPATLALLTAGGLAMIRRRK